MGASLLAISGSYRGAAGPRSLLRYFLQMGASRLNVNRQSIATRDDLEVDHLHGRSFARYIYSVQPDESFNSAITTRVVLKDAETFKKQFGVRYTRSSEA